MSLLFQIVSEVVRNKKIFLIALIYALFVFSFTSESLIVGDSAVYGDIAKNIAEGNGFYEAYSPSTTSPIFPLVWGFFMFLFERSLSIKICLSVISFVFLLSVYYLSKELFDKRIAELTFILTLTIPIVVFLTLRPLTDILFVSFLNISVLMYLKFLKEGKPVFLVLCSVLTALSYLTRITGIVLFGVFIIHQLYLFLIKRNFQFKEIMLFVLIFLLAISPWLLRNYYLGLEINEVYHIKKLQNAPKSEFIFSLKDGINGDIYIQKTLPFQIGNLIRMPIILTLFFMPVLLLTFLYDAVERIKKLRKIDRISILSFLWILGFLMPPVTITPAFSIRYVLPLLVPVLIPFSVFIRKNFNRKKILCLVLIAAHLSSMVFVSLWYYDTRFSKYNTNVFLDAGNWIKSHTNDDQKFALFGLTSQALSYFGGRKSYDVNEDVDYLIVSDNYRNNTAFDKYNLCASFSDENHFIKIYGKKCR